ncbi:unnamed protein product [Pylaiella littoralis]
MQGKVVGPVHQALMLTDTPFVDVCGVCVCVLAHALKTAAVSCVCLPWAVRGGFVLVTCDLPVCVQCICVTGFHIIRFQRSPPPDTTDTTDTDKQDQHSKQARDSLSSVNLFENMGTDEPPPPAYSGDPAQPPPASYPAPPPPASFPAPPPPDGHQAPPAYQGGTVKPPTSTSACCAGNGKIYWVYWGVLFATVLTWVFAVCAAASDGLISIGSVNGISFEDDCKAVLFWSNDSDTCKIFEAAKAFQYSSTILVSIIVVLVLVAAFMPAPITGKLGLSVGISLVVYSVFQLLAFALMTAFAVKYAEPVSYVTTYSSTAEYDTGATAGPSVGLAIVAWILGTAGAVVTLVFFRRATTNQDGPFRKCLANVAPTNAGARPHATQSAAPAGAFPSATV